VADAVLPTPAAGGAAPGTGAGAGAPPKPPGRLGKVLKAPWRAVDSVSGGLIKFFETVGDVLLLGVQTFVWLLRPPYRAKLFFEQMEFVGVGSLSIIFLTGTFTGAVIAVQTIFNLAKFRQEGLYLAGAALALTRELSPVLGALMVTARAGSAMATELGTMRITEQIEAMATMAVSPVQYLVTPRVAATVVMMPVLTMVFNGVGIGGAYLLGVHAFGVDPGPALENFRLFTDPADIYMGLVKSLVFGVVLSVVSCYNGFNAAGGAKGVGNATTRSVVWSAVAILVLDYVITDLMTERLA